jgi:sugar phosphate isomerase/epimerase
MHRLSLAQLTAIGLTAPEIIYLAGDIGCEGVALNPGLINIDLGGPISRLDNDPAMRRATAQALADTGVTIDLMDAVGLTPDFSLAANATQLDIFGELGATQFNVAVMDPELARVKDNLAAVCELAGKIGMTPMMEFFALGGCVPSLKEAMKLINSGKYPNLKLLIDTLHLARAGETPADLAAIDPALIGAAQICDGAVAYPGFDAYLYEAIFERGIPGEGELPLVEFLQVIPADIIVSPEVPLKSLRDAGVPIEECARRAIEGTRRVAEAVLAA